MTRAKLARRLALAALIGGWLWATAPYTRTWGTCVLCRADREEGTLWAIPWSRVRETECSRWYGARIEARHDHIWERGSCYYFGGCGRRGHATMSSSPIRYVFPSIQLRAYQNIADPAEAKALFAKFADARDCDEVIDEYAEPKGQVLALSVDAWVTAGCPGKWADWWAKSWRAHIEAHDRHARERDEADRPFREYMARRGVTIPVRGASDVRQVEDASEPPNR